VVTRSSGVRRASVEDELERVVLTPHLLKRQVTDVRAEHTRIDGPADFAHHTRPRPRGSDGRAARLRSIHPVRVMARGGVHRTVKSVQRLEATLTRLAIADDAYYERLLSRDSANVEESHLDEKTHALVRLGALVAMDAPSPGYMRTIETARRLGASDDEIIGCLIAVLPALGVARVVSAAPNLGLALGYDVTAALEASD
jgi:4-carboxymuconolactone decarboxylase